MATTTYVTIQDPHASPGKALLPNGHIVVLAPRREGMTGLADAERGVDGPS